jgi:hypothetical protein
MIRSEADQPNPGYRHLSSTRLNGQILSIKRERHSGPVTHEGDCPMNVIETYDNYVNQPPRLKSNRQRFYAVRRLIDESFYFYFLNSPHQRSAAPSSRVRKSNATPAAEKGRFVLCLADHYLLPGKRNQSSRCSCCLCGFVAVCT